MSMCLDVTGFMKDNMNAMKDLATLCDCPLLDAKTNAKGNLSRPRDPYYLLILVTSTSRFVLSKSQKH
jgi:hypothetical protein